VFTQRKLLFSKKLKKKKKRESFSFMYFHRDSFNTGCGAQKQLKKI
jgi:hypothetical protein